MLRLHQPFLSGHRVRGLGWFHSVGLLVTLGFTVLYQPAWLLDPVFKLCDEVWQSTSLPTTTTSQQVAELVVSLTMAVLLLSTAVTRLYCSCLNEKRPTVLSAVYGVVIALLIGHHTMQLYAAYCRPEFSSAVF